MESINLSMISSASSSSTLKFFPQSFIHPSKSRILRFTSRKPRKVSISASKDEPKLDEWDQMELRFGRMIGEDPKMTLAKIMGRKVNPDMSYLEIEKLFDNKKKGKSSNGEIEEVPFDVSGGKKLTESVEGINLVRPVPKKGVKFQSTDKQVESNNKKYADPISKATKETLNNVPNVILRKPNLFNEDDDDNGKYSKFEMKPNLTLRMWKEPQKERFSDITLLKKPEHVTVNPDKKEEKDPSNSVDANVQAMDESQDKNLTHGMLLQKPELINVNLNDEPRRESSEKSTDFSISSDVTTERSNISHSFNESAAELQDDTSAGGDNITSDESSKSTSAVSMDTVLMGKPKRLGVHRKAENQESREEVIPLNLENFGDPLVLENFITNSSVKEHEDDDWAKAEELVQTGQRQEVELISSSGRGFAVSFGSLIGFLPYRNLAARWKFLAFESWVRKKGLDPSIYRNNLGVIGNYEAAAMTDSAEQGAESEIDYKATKVVSPDMKLEELLVIYDQEKLKFLSSFVGQKIKVGVVLANRNSRRLIFSIKPKEKEELVEKKRSLMARLSVGDVIKCCIKKITYFGVFVEVEGVPALIHQSEVSWDTTLDPESYFKVGQIVDAKVHQLDFSLERIFLSLKEIMPDPLIEALEAVVGDHESLGGGLEAAEADAKWADVESLIKELQEFDGIHSVSKGRYLLSPGLAPTFQVYMASMFKNQYKLLARAGNRVQEVIVQTSLGKEELKSAILTCTNRVK